MGSMSVLNHHLLPCVAMYNKVFLTISVRQCCKTPKNKTCPVQKKPVSVADRTINLADPRNKYCVKPVRRELVVQKNPCAAPPRRAPPPSTGRPVPQQIRVCRASDMKKVCPPKPCTCPPKKPPESFKSKAKRWALFLLKAAVAGGVVYWTIEEGVWDTGDKAVEIYQNLVSNMILIYHGGDVEVDSTKVKIPKSDKMIHQAKETWNKGVVLVCGFIGTAPGRVIALVYKPEECKEGDDAVEGGAGEAEGENGASGKSGGGNKGGGKQGAKGEDDNWDFCEDQEDEEC